MRNLKVTVNGTVYDVQVEEVGTSETPVASASALAPAFSAPQKSAPVAAAPAPAPAAREPKKADAGSETIESPMPGAIVGVNVADGQNVKKGDTLVVLEAMKMENEIMAPRDAEVAAVLVAKGDSVQAGTPLVSLR